MSDQSTIFRSQAIDLLHELMSKPNHPYRMVTDHDGLVDTLRAVSAAAASARLVPDDPTSTIAAHVGHVAFAFTTWNAWLEGNRAAVDWSASWNHQTVDDRVWHDLRDRLDAGCVTIEATLQTVELDSPEAIGGAMAMLAHLAYHIGAIQQKIAALAARTAG